MNSLIKPRAAALIAVAAALAGCAPSTPHWDSSFGNSVRASVAAQVIDPAAVRNTNPVSGLDTQAALGIAGQYGASYAKPATAPAPMTTGKAR